MAVQAQFGGLAGCLLPYGGGLAEEQLQALLSAAASTKAQQYHCAAGLASAAQSGLTCNGGASGLGGVVASRKRSRNGELEHQYSSALLLPIPGAVVRQTPPAANVPSGRTADSAAASTSGRPLSTADALVAAEVDALVRAGCERLRAGLERARKRQCEALARGAARALREKEAELEAARQRAAELEERLRQAAAEAQAWCGLARSSEAAASGLRATLDAVLLRAGAGGAAAWPAAQGEYDEEEGFGESGGAAEGDTQSCCFVEAKWACRACREREASVLLLPCRHLCVCKAPRLLRRQERIHPHRAQLMAWRRLRRPRQRQVTAPISLAD